MPLDPDRMLRAVRTRDRRFDGQFFFGVVTYGVYCRPSCPGGGAKPENLRFYRDPAAAEAAGLRACRRCRPECAPGSPAGRGTSAIVSRGLRLIATGAFEELGDERFAARLGLGARQVRRVFQQHLGATPAAVARTRRIHFARRLIDESDLPMTAVAGQAGFRSLRQFNHWIRQSFDATPGALRRRRKPPTDPGLALRLPYREPFDWSGMLDFLRLRAIGGVEEIGDECYRRVIAVGESAQVIEVARDPTQPALVLRLAADEAPALLPIAERARQCFDLDADPLAIDRDLAADPLLARRVERRPGVRVPGAWDPFEVGVRAIVGQQISVRAATTIVGRLVRAHGKPLDRAAGTLTHAFPTPSALAAADLSAIGLPRSRAAALRALAEALARGAIDLGPDAAHTETRAALLALPGIGPWTADYIALRALRDPDAFLPGDLGLRRALARRGTPPTPAELLRRAERWRPWRAYAAIRLWCDSAPNARRS